MTRSLTICTLTILLLFSMAAQAAFHQWIIAEVYSNADGTVQFIELVGEIDNQHLLQDHTMVANSDGAVNSITFPNNSRQAAQTTVHGTCSISPVSRAILDPCQDHTPRDRL